jgi:FemAB-related protein (PEP-CTERM system-associated)
MSLSVPVSAFTVHAASNRDEWTRFVDAHPDATAYHDWRWRDVFLEAFQHPAHYLEARVGGEICGVLPLVRMHSRLFGRFLVSLPFVNYGGFLVRSPEAGRALVDRAALLARDDRCSHIELRHQRRELPERPVRQHKVAMRLQLLEPEALWTSLDRKVRNQVRKAERSQLEAFHGGPELLDEFYAIFRRNMRDLGTPVYSRRFFEAVLKYFPDRTVVHVVRRGDETIAAGITLSARRTVEVPWASSLREHLALCPNNLLYWSIIRWASEGGFATLDFGRSTPDEGTFHFKRQWGAVPSPLYWEYVVEGNGLLPHFSPDNPRYRAAVAMWKHLPLGVANLLGPHIVRGIP